MPQVEAKGARPPLGHVEAPLQIMVTKETSSLVVASSVRHKAQVLQRVSFPCRPPGSFIPFIAYSRLILVALMHRSLAQSIYTTTIIISEAQPAVSPCNGWMFDGSELVVAARCPLMKQP